jgi:hypothetical protein
MSDDYDVEDDGYARHIERTHPVTAYGLEVARRKSRREAVADELASQRTQRRIAEDRENAKWCRPLTSKDVADYDAYQAHTSAQNHQTSRELRDRDRLLEKLDALMKRDHETYMERFSDRRAQLQGIKQETYKGN